MGICLSTCPWQRSGIPKPMFCKIYGLDNPMAFTKATGITKTRQLGNHKNEAAANKGVQCWITTEMTQGTRIRGANNGFPPKAGSEQPEQKPQTFTKIHPPKFAVVICLTV